MTIYGKLFIICFGLYVSGCVFVTVTDSKDKHQTEEAPFIENGAKEEDIKARS